MTISSSLNAGVAGLNAHAARLATISDNIANSATYGYKRSVTEFNAMVVGATNDVRYTAGGVLASSMRLVDERGSLVSTSNATDLAVNGRGFLPVTDIASVGEQTQAVPVSLVTTGSFRLDATGILRSESGQVLMGWPADRDGTVPEFPRDSFSALEPVRISRSELVGNPTQRIALGVNLPATATEAGAAGSALDMTVEYFGNLSTSQSLQIGFAPTVPATGSSNEWTMTIRDSAADGAVVGEYTLVFDGTQATGGRLDSVTALTGGAYDPATGEIALTVGGGQIQLAVGAADIPGGLSQLSDSFIPASIVKDGSPVATLSSVQVDESGNLRALYDQGFSELLYRVPIIDVPNPNGLIALNNQAYRVSPASGGFFLWNPGDGPVGTVAAFAREESATDVAGELTQLIQTQRAYSSNAKVIQTVDEMLQETTNIKR